MMNEELSQYQKESNKFSIIGSFRPVVLESTQFSIEKISSFAENYQLFGFHGYESHELTEAENFAFHTRAVDGSNHKVFKNNENEPSCCNYHQKIFYDILPKLNKTDDPLALAKKVVLVLAYTEDFIQIAIKRSGDNSLSNHYLKYIYDYIEYSCVSFGLGAYGHEPYLVYLQRFIEESNIQEKSKQDLLNIIKIAKKIFKQTGFPKQLDQNLWAILNKWKELFPYNLEKIANIDKSWWEEPLIPVYLKRNCFEIDITFVSKYSGKELTQILCDLTRQILELLSSVNLFGKGLLNDPNIHKLELLVASRKHKLKTGYIRSDSDIQPFLDIIEEWFADEKDFLSEITPLIRSLPEEMIKTKPVLSRMSEDISSKLISFSDDAVLEDICQLLKGYFIGNESNLKTALEGKKLEEPIVFPYSQNKLVEVFRRLKYNGYIPSRTTEIRDWLCINFHYRYKKGQKDQVRKLNPDSVWDILSKGRGEPTKKERICFENVDWLPYKSPLQLSRASESEQL